MSSETTAQPPDQDHAPEKANGVSRQSTLPGSSTSAASSTIQDMIAPLLQFLGDASNPTLGACFAGLLLALILVFGRAGLILLGAAAGFALHAAWSGSSLLPGENSDRNKDPHWRGSGFDVAERIFNWHERRASTITAYHDADSQQQPNGPQDLVATKKTDFTKLPPATSAALSSLTDAVIRDYVSWWYSPILPAERTFISASRDVFSSFLFSVSSHLSRKRPADIFLESLANASSLMIVVLNELANALSSSSSSASIAEGVNQYVTSNRESKLASIIDRNSQERKMRAAAEDLLKQFLDPPTLQCKPAYIFLREVLAGVVLKMTLESCSKPHWINEWIVFLLEETEIGQAVANTSLPVQDAGSPFGNIPGSTAADTFNGSPTPNGTDSEGPNRKMSKAEAAMAQAILEAQKMNQLIAEEEARRKVNSHETPDVSTPDSASIGRMSMMTPDESETASTDLGRPTVSEDLRETSIGRPSTQTTTEPNTVDLDSSAKFTTFDQLIPDRTPTALRSQPHEFTSSPTEKNDPLTLYEANVSILDDSSPTGKSVGNSKSNIEFLIQIEPALSTQPGWMIARKYTDFETLHEVLRRISVISGVAGFQHTHGTLPPWKGRTRTALQEDLEGYLQDALSYRQLADSEGMKRFLEKNTRNLGRASTGFAGKGGFPNAFGTVGKGMLDVLANAPKGVGGVLGGVSSLAQMRPRASSRHSGKDSVTSAGVAKSTQSLNVPANVPANKWDTHGEVSQSQQSFPSRSGRASSLDLLSGDESIYGGAPTAALGNAASSRTSLNPSSTGESSRPSSIVDTPQQSPLADLGDIRLPPLPIDIPDDYGSTATKSFSTKPAPLRSTTSIDMPSTEIPTPNPASSNTTTTKTRPEASRLTDEETQVAVDLSFAVVNELYNLSSAWNIRRTLLLAAKNFLNLDTVRTLIQESIIDANTTDAAIAGYIRKMEENALPTEAQLKAWPPPPSEDEKERTRRKARKLLMDKGLPPALTGVMGNAASREALGKVFDCLQLEEVARGLMFGLMMQGLRVLSQ
ncbi:MAG: hypothetical protein M1823_002446 [Watsoniomyces obsoletus]|nr:MAG: hypothetical protein M1823_002446 [Watsoniomyces obsoletus]